MSYVPARLRREVIRRAAGRCEYCGLAQESEYATFHMDHIVPQSSGGLSVPENLALACVMCSLRKGLRESAVDPVTGRRVRLFHPRNDRWWQHYRWDGVLMDGLTATGRATILLLKLNDPQLLRMRREEMKRGLHPPPRTLGRDGSAPPPKG